MLAEIPSNNYNQLEQDYSNAIDWMKSIGVKFKSGRTQHYLKTINYWKDNYKSAAFTEVEEKFPDFVSSMYEIHDFIEVHKALGDVAKRELGNLVQKLDKAVNGPLHAIDEDSNTSNARNFLFEALLDARAHRPERSIVAILDSFSDSGILIDQKRIWVECKRVSSKDKLKSNVKKARDQLIKTFPKKVGSGHRGLVALEVTKLMAPSDYLFAAHNDFQLQSEMSRLMDNFIHENSHIWLEILKGSSPKIIGVIVRFSLMCASEERNLLVKASEWAINPRNNIKEVDRVLLQHLAKNLKA